MKYLIFIFLFSLTSCAKLSYIFSQAEGQISLLHKAKDNQKVLDDVTVPDKFKDKIRSIEKYKQFFVRYFDFRPNQHYSKTTFLRSKAVSYLVIYSPKNKIEAQNSCFPFVGCFPYLGFFDEKAAVKFADLKKEEGFSTYMREVYAYSTLGHFSDPILSSFFYYDDFELSELIFHELFHTYFFVKDEVDFNENLATFFAIELQKIYYQNSEELKQKLIDSETNRELSQFVASLALQLQKRYEEAKGQNILSDFLTHSFYPQVKQKCEELKIGSCYPLEGKWNNARFAAFLTYESKNSELKNLFKKSNLSLKAFFLLIKQRYDKFLEQSERGTFETYLFNRSP